MIYLITRTDTGRKYVGRKYFFRRIPPLKGKKRRRKVQSDWKKYYGSNEILREEVDELGVEQFRREILSLHQTKGATNYYETRELFVRDALTNPLYYNDCILRYRNVNLSGSLFLESSNSSDMMEETFMKEEDGS